jgi:hypothetical protein
LHAHIKLIIFQQSGRNGGGREGGRERGRKGGREGVRQEEEKVIGGIPEVFLYLSSRTNDTNPEKLP